MSVANTVVLLISHPVLSSGAGWLVFMAVMAQNSFAAVERHAAMRLQRVTDDPQSVHGRASHRASETLR